MRDLFELGDGPPRLAASSSGDGRPVPPFALQGGPAGALAQLSVSDPEGYFPFFFYGRTFIQRLRMARPWRYRERVLHAAVGGAACLALALLVGLLVWYLIRRHARLEDSLARTVAEARTADERLGWINANAPGLICEYDCRLHRYTYVSDFIDRIGLGRLRGAPAKDWLACIEPADRARVADELGRALAAKKPFIMEYRIRNSSGEVMWFTSHNSCVVEDGEVVRVVGMVEDSTARKKAEAAGALATAQLAAARRYEATSLLASGVAHDFRNLLQVILGQAELAALDLPKMDPSAAAFDEIRRTAIKATGITNELLAFARQQTIEPEVLDLGGVLEDSKDILVRLGDGVRVELNRPAEPCRVKMDNAQVCQLVSNLIVNARDAIREAKRTDGVIRVALRRASVPAGVPPPAPGLRPGDYVILSVADNGCGVTPEVQRRMFDPFFTTKPKGKGNGLGLSTVHGIAGQNGGAVSLKTVPGEGSEFMVWLPEHKGTN